MKKLVAAILVFTFLWCGISTYGMAEADPSGYMQRIYAANRTEAWKLRHTSTQTHMVGVNDIDYTVYWDGEYQIEVNPSEYGYYGIRVTCDRYDYIAREDGGFRRFVSLDTQADMYQIFDVDILQEEVLSAEESDGALVVTTAAGSGEVSEYYAQTRNVSQVQEERVYTLDPDTMEMRSFRREAVFPDGSREVYREITVEHDVDRPHLQAVEAIEAHLSTPGQMRTTTFIYDEGTACARTYIFPTQVGDQIYLWGFDQYGIRYVIDPERSIPANEARDNDAVYYLVRAEE